MKSIWSHRRLRLGGTRRSRRPQSRAGGREPVPEEGDRLSPHSLEEASVGADQHLHPRVEGASPPRRLRRRRDPSVPAADRSEREEQEQASRQAQRQGQGEGEEREQRRRSDEEPEPRQRQGERQKREQGRRSKEEPEPRQQQRRHRPRQEVSWSALRAPNGEGRAPGS